MTRIQEITNLRARYFVAAKAHKRKTAAMIFARLSQLTTKQLKAELRQERKAS